MAIKNTGSENTGYGNSGHRNSGNRNSGYGNSGYGNSTDRESGIFCNAEGKVRMFNKPTNLTWDEIDHPHFTEFYLCKWISESEMTDEEKKADTQFYVRGGYLKTYTYKEMITLAALLKKRYELSEMIKDDALLDMNLLADIHKKAIAEEIGMSSNGVECMLSKLRKTGIIKDNRINKRFIPNLDLDAKSFNMIVVFDIQNG